MAAYANGATPNVTTGYRYAPIPEAVLYDHALTATAIRVYGALIRHGLDPASCYPSHERLGELLGCSARSIQRPMTELEKAGWITRVRRHNARGERTSDGYHVHTENAQLCADNRAESSARPDANLPLVHRAETSEERKQSFKESKIERKASTGVDAGLPAQIDATKTAANLIAKRFWTERQEAGNPSAQKFVAIRAVVESMLRNGLGEPEIEWAMRAAPVVSSNAIELALSQRRKPSGAVARQERNSEIISRVIAERSRVVIDI